MSGLNLVYLFITLSFIFGDSHVNNTNDLASMYEAGIEYYRIGKYEKSKNLFESILEKNWESPELYYNLGNAYYRLENVSGAVWSYEMCLHHDPTHEDAQFNLTLANINVKDRIEMPEAPFLLKLYFSIKEKFTPNMWIKIVLSLLVVLAIFSILKLYIGRSTVSMVVDNILIFLIISSFSFSLHSIWTNEKYDEGVIVSEAVNVYSEPNSHSTFLFKIHEGLKVSMNDVSQKWVEIELIDGKNGWIQLRQIRPIK